ncbi:MAG: PAS domain-containing sensor histidine kinase [Gemmatimonadetes bacterium]|nr:PAS domain-containing sensor histidine kinase [Gemmatimonadota bacterium]
MLALALAAGLPGTVVALTLLVVEGYSAKVLWTFGLLVMGFWLGFAFALRERVVRPLQTLSNLLAALLEGDYSIRSRGATTDDALGLAMLEVNALGETLREQRLGALEASALLRTVMEEIEVAIFAFDDALKLRLVNRAGERLLDMPAERMSGRTAQALGLAELLAGEDQRVVDATFPGARGRWDLRRSMFRQGGAPHQLLVLSDLSKTLREEELIAWQRLIRVLSHEINNSLAPIKSIAGSLITTLSRGQRPADADEDLERGLGIIAGRSEALQRFMASYARLARLPAPELAPVDVGDWVRRVVALETRLDVHVDTGPHIVIRADGDQLDQLLINLVRNGVDAALETGGAVSVGWSGNSERVAVQVRDEGPGLADTTNLFVPFFTTKRSGSGIGLALSRQIVDAHGGFLTVENRKDSSGAIATITLPVQASSQP